MRSTFAFLAVAVAVVIGVGVAAASVQPRQVNRTTTGLSSGVSGTVPSASDLELSAELSGTQFYPGQAITLKVVETNTLNYPNEVSAADDWATENLTLGPCGGNLPFGFAVFQGSFSSGSSANTSHALQLYASGFYNCPAILDITGYTFNPDSSIATPTGCGGVCYSMAMASDSTFSGYLTGNSSEPLSPGLYTVVVGDEWGAEVLLHFTVLQGSESELVILPAGTSFTVSSSYDCVAGHYSVPFNSTGPSTLSGAFTARSPGVTLYVATSQQAASLTDGHPSAWLYSTTLTTSGNFSVPVVAGPYLIWVEGANANCGASIVEPLEVLTQVNVTQSIVLS